MLFAIAAFCIVLADIAAAIPTNRATDEDIRVISSEIWANDRNRLLGSDVQYNANGPQLYSFVNTAAFSETFTRMIAMFDNYTPQTGIAETCGAACDAEEDAFLDAILLTEPIRLLHTFLIGEGLASASVVDFKNELRQYWFMKYTRSGGPLDSSGFEHTFCAEIKNNAVSGGHNWVRFYYEEMSGDFTYGPYQATCQPEILKFGFNWIGYNKPISSAFMRSSPEAEIALCTLCLLTRTGTGCPIRLGGVQLTMTAWDMTGLPKTIGSSYPNC
jgi:poly(U)-specific endoribonuclease